MIRTMTRANRRSVYLALLAGSASLSLVTQSRANEEEASQAGMRDASLSVEGDADSSHVFNGSLGLPLGERGHLDLGAGRSRATLDEIDEDSTFASIDLGLDTRRTQMQIGYAFRDDGDSFRQHDFRGKFTLVRGIGRIGFDLFYRDAQDETLGSIRLRRRDSRAIRVIESISGTGIGLHGAIDATHNVHLFASGMIYDYDRDVDTPALLARFPRLSLRVTGVTRDEAFLDNTVRAGIDYTLSLLTLTATYTRDVEIDTHDITNTGELTADIPVGERWLVSPWVGYSSDESDGGTAFAGMSVSVMW
jgi:hypothetical protein